MSAAFNISKEIGFKEGVSEAIMLKIFTLEVTGDIAGAFHMAVLLKTLDLEVSHLYLMSITRHADKGGDLKIVNYLLIETFLLKWDLVVFTVLYLVDVYS